MIWECQWCGLPRLVPAVNPVGYVCDECGREAGGVFDEPPRERELADEERELVEVRVTWRGTVPDTDTLRALRAFVPQLRDEPLGVVVDALRQKGYYALGVHCRIDARQIVEDARLHGLQAVVEKAQLALRR
jgi:hypothetical protein